MTKQAEILEDIDGRRMLDSLKFRLAAEIAPRGWRKPLSNLAKLLDDGQNLEEAFDQSQPEMPGDLSSLLQEAIRLRDPAGMLIDAIRIRNRTQSSWRALLAICAYPAVLFVLALSVGVAFSFCMRSMVSLQFMEDFGLNGVEGIQAAIDDQNHAIIGLAMITVWVLVVLLTIYFLGPPWAWLAVVGGMLVVGKPLRWLSLQEIIYRYRLFFDYGLESVQAVDAVARSFRSSRQAIYSESIARSVHRGVPIGKALGNCTLTDGLCRPVLLLIDQRGDEMAQSMTDSAEVLGRMADHRCRSLTTVIPVFALAMVATILFGAIASYLMALTPLIMMISSLA